jgi:hypothetical protein
LIAQYVHTDLRKDGQEERCVLPRLRVFLHRGRTAEAKALPHVGFGHAQLVLTLVWSVNLAAAFCVGRRRTGFGGLGIVSVSLFADFFAVWFSAAGIACVAAIDTDGHLAALDVDD